LTLEPQVNANATDRVAREAGGLPLPVDLGHPQMAHLPQCPEGDGERVRVRGSQGLRPVSAAPR
jgi:hypothetical protein